MSALPQGTSTPLPRVHAGRTPSLHRTCAKSRAGPVNSNIGHRKTMNSTEPRAAGISHHFRREAKLMMSIFLLVLLLGLLIAVFAPKIMQFIAADKCLDAGGAFNYKTNACVGAENQPQESAPHRPDIAPATPAR